MNRTRMLAAASLAALGAAVLAQGAGATTPKLSASVSDPLNISLKVGTAKVTKLKAGIYTVVVQDKASDHNFHLKGPGVNKATSVSGKISTVWKVTLKKRHVYLRLRPA